MNVYNLSLLPILEPMKDMASDIFLLTPEKKPFFFSAVNFAEATMVSLSFSKKDLYSSFGGHFFSMFIMNDMTSLEVSASSSAIVMVLLWLPLELDPLGPAEPEGLPLGLPELEPEPVVSLREAPILKLEEEEFIAVPCTVIVFAFEQSLSPILKSFL